MFIWLLCDLSNTRLWHTLHLRNHRRNTTANDLFKCSTIHTIQDALHLIVGAVWYATEIQTVKTTGPNIWQVPGPKTVRDPFTSRPLLSPVDQGWPQLKPNGRHIWYCFIEMQNGARIPIYFNWLASCAKWNSAHCAQDANRQHPPQPQSVHPAAIWLKTENDPLPYQQTMEQHLSSGCETPKVILCTPLN